MTKLTTPKLAAWLKQDGATDWIARRYGLSQDQLEAWKRDNRAQDWLPFDWSGTPVDLLLLVGVERDGYRTLTLEVVAWFVLRRQLFDERTLRVFACKWGIEAMGRKKATMMPSFKSMGLAQLAIDHLSGKATNQDCYQAYLAATRVSQGIGQYDPSGALFNLHAEPHKYHPETMAIAMLDPCPAFSALSVAALDGWVGFQRDLVAYFPPKPSLTERLSGFIRHLFIRRTL